MVSRLAILFFPHMQNFVEKVTPLHGAKLSQFMIFWVKFVKICAILSKNFQTGCYFEKKNYQNLHNFGQKVSKLALFWVKPHDKNIFQNIHLCLPSTSNNPGADCRLLLRMDENGA